MWGRFIAFLISLTLVFGAGFAVYSYIQETKPPYFKPATTVVEEIAPARNSVSGEERPILKQTPATSLSQPIEADETTVAVSGPLYGSTSTPAVSDVLTEKGIILETNAARVRESGLPPLQENITLDHDAELKLKDLFAKQYFEHISPSGVGPADLARQVGYAYIIVGENLALGDFKGDQKLVEAWMQSPGHRANILNARYQDIGVAVGRGTYQGRTVWIAVQSFGMPRSACPLTDTDLRNAIDARNRDIATSRDVLDEKKAFIATLNPEDPTYSAYVDEYNALIAPYNALVEANKQAVETYNAQVALFNACVNSVVTH